MDWTETAGFDDGLPNGGVGPSEPQPGGDAEQPNGDWVVGQNELPGADKLPWLAGRQL